MQDKILKENTTVAEWNPVELDEIQYCIIEELCQKGIINLSQDMALEDFVKTGNYSTLADFIDKLKSTGLVYVETNFLKLLTDQCQCAILPSGKFVAGENKSGRFMNWILKENQK